MTRALLPDVLVPKRGVGGDEVTHEANTLLIIGDLEQNTALSNVLFRPSKGAILPNHDARNAIQQRCAAAHVAWGQRRVQCGASIVRGAEAARVLQAVHLGVKGGASFLYTSIMSTPDDSPVDDEHRANGNPTLRQSRACFGNRGREKGISNH